MTELELYKYITENDIEFHWNENDGKEDVIIFIYHFNLEALCKLMEGFLDDGGYNCVLRDSYVCIWMNEICDYFGIDINNVFQKETV